MKNYWFFLSYSRSDYEGNPELKKFYDDLVKELRQATGDNENGFIDQKGIEVGGDWPQDLALALQNCRSSFFFIL